MRHYGATADAFRPPGGPPGRGTPAGVPRRPGRPRPARAFDLRRTPPRRSAVIGRIPTLLARCGRAWTTPPSASSMSARPRAAAGRPPSARSAEATGHTRSGGVPGTALRGDPPRSRYQGSDEHTELSAPPGLRACGAGRKRAGSISPPPAEAAQTASRRRSPTCFPQRGTEHPQAVRLDADPSTSTPAAADITIASMPPGAARAQPADTHRRRLRRHAVRPRHPLDASPRRHRFTGRAPAPEYAHPESAPQEDHRRCPPRRRAPPRSALNPRTTHARGSHPIWGAAAAPPTARRPGRTGRSVHADRAGGRCGRSPPGCRNTGACGNGRVPAPRARFRPRAPARATRPAGGA